MYILNITQIYFSNNNSSAFCKQSLGYKRTYRYLYVNFKLMYRVTFELRPHNLYKCGQRDSMSRAGHLQFFNFFYDKNDIFCIFYQVNLTGGGLFKWNGAEIGYRVIVLKK